MRYNLPEDLKPFEPKRSIKILRIIAHVLISILMFNLGKWLGQTVFKTNPTLKIIVYVVFGVIIAVFIVSLFFERAPDLTYAGKIEDVKVRTKTKSKTHEKPTAESHRTVYNIELFIRDPEGAARWISAAEYSSEDIDSDYIDKFKPGAEVFHLHGTKKAVLLPTDGDASVACAVCGAINPKEDLACRSCGHTLIKSLDQIKQ